MSTPLEQERIELAAVAAIRQREQAVNDAVYAALAAAGSSWKMGQLPGSRAIRVDVDGAGYLIYARELGA